ncbi:MAG: tetratricopeptide repeat protein [Proteobacteria bacterium]|nr:tetratricopeptide repeat protein [Pseudomonadota bacterium]
MKPLQRAAGHFQRGEYDQVEQICGRILAVDADNARAWQMRGLAALHLKQFEKAVAYLTEAVTRQETPQTLINLSVAFLALDRPPDAIVALQAALQLDPTNPGALLNLAACYLREKRYEDAEGALTRALAIKPHWPKAMEMLGRIEMKRGNFERVTQLANAALAADPALSVSHRLLADIAMREGDFETASDHYELSLKNNPDDAETHGNFALLLARRGSYQQAETWYRHAAEILRDDEATNQAFAEVLLIQGNLKEGWRQHAWRHMRTEEAQPIVDRPFLSDMPSGARAVAVLDQGIGDQILMAGLIPDLSRRIAGLEIECDPRLHALLRRSFPGVQFTRFIMRAPGAVPTPGSFGVADTAPWLRPRFEDFPAHRGYLKADPVLQKILRERYIEKSRGPVIGISWATRRVKLGAHKSLPLAAWGPLLSMPGVTFVNLQYDSDPAEVAEATRQFGARIITDTTIDPSGDLDAYAAQVAAMDLVISTSSAAAHFGGALNVPTWVFVPAGFGGLWHWFLDRGDSPWYPSVRLFRQTQRGEWQDVVARASADFAIYVEQWAARNP